jgi:hypothetical protein
LSLHRKYLRILSALAPSGAIGISILLASSAPSTAREHPASAEPPTAPSPRVSERLDAIRGAMSEFSGLGIAAVVPVGDERRVAWFNGGWGNGGFGIFLGPPWGNWHDWNNWHNWGNGWRNGGWGNGSPY